jgi:hypothetical protein
MPRRFNLKTVGHSLMGPVALTAICGRKSSRSLHSNLGLKPIWTNRRSRWRLALSPMMAHKHWLIEGWDGINFFRWSDEGEWAMSIALWIAGSTGSSL